MKEERMPHPATRVSPAASAPRALAAVGVGDIAQVLEELASDLVLEPVQPPARGRPRILPSLVLWGALLLNVLEGQVGQRAVWRRISGLGLWHVRPLAISDQAVYNRLEREGTAPLQALFGAVTAALAVRVVPWTRRELAPFATGVYAIDETTLDPLTRALTDPATGARTRPLPGKLAGCFNVRTQLWERLLPIADAHQNEKVTARALVRGLGRGSLVLFDLGYFAFQWFDELTQGGVWYVTRWREGTSYTVLHAFHDHGDCFDGLVWVGAYRADRARYAARLITFRRGRQVHRYLTNVLDPQRLSPAEVAALYARRWDIELAIKLVKTHLGLSLWWSTKDVVIAQQLWATLTIAQVLAALRLEIAGRAGVDPFDVSVALLVETLPQYAVRGLDPVATFVAQGRRLGFIRPSRRIRIVVDGFDPATYQPPPPDLPLQRPPRYAHRRSLPHTT
jgi:hypothetical protein